MAPVDLHGKRKAQKAPGPSPPAKTQIAPAEGQAAPPLTTLFKTTKIFLRGDQDYKLYQYQYGLSSHIQDGYMAPAAIIYPQPDNADSDVQVAIRYATTNGLAIAVRTGGHQYSGASSTYGENIQLDMSEAYTEFEYDPATGLVHLGVSFELTVLNTLLGKHGLFVPTGQCSHVHVGGHAQSGGYGQLARAFGLFGDHIMRIRIITADESVRVLERGAGTQEDRDLFYGVLGGSPGNYGVLTHIWIRPHKDSDHPNSRGLKALTLYNKNILSQLMKVLSEMSDDDDTPGDIDYCVTVLSHTTNILHWYHLNLDTTQLLESLRAPQFKALFGNNENPIGWPAIIMVYVQWSNLKGPNQHFDPTFFNKVKKALSLGGLPLYIPLVSDDKHTPISALTRQWIFTNVREYNLPYEKRVFVTRSTTLTPDNFAGVVTDRIHLLETDHGNGCKIVVQIQPFGGKYSAHRNLASDDTAFSFRDATVGCTLDAFYDVEDFAANFHHRNPKQEAIKWQAKNDELLKGPNGCLSKGQDLRWLWGSYGDINLANVWQCYYEDQAKYDRLCAIKNTFDPQGVFTPNPFCVGATPGLRAVRVDASAAKSAEMLPAEEAQVSDSLRKRFDEKNVQMLKALF